MLNSLFCKVLKSAPWKNSCWAVVIASLLPATSSFIIISWDPSAFWIIKPLPLASDSSIKGIWLFLSLFLFSSFILLLFSFIRERASVESLACVKPILLSAANFLTLASVLSFISCLFSVTEEFSICKSISAIFKSISLLPT